MYTVIFSSFQFFRDELKHENGHILQVNFHGSDDLISVNDLWELWIQSSGECLSRIINPKTVKVLHFEITIFAYWKLCLPSQPTISS